MIDMDSDAVFVRKPLYLKEENPYAVSMAG